MTARIRVLLVEDDLRVARVNRDLLERDPDVSAYVLSQPGAGRFLEQYLPVLRTVAEGYLTEGKRFMQVAVGCTGGKHRSVAMTEAIAGLLRESGYDVRPAHRDLGRE